MANTYSQIYLHLVFAVQGRTNLVNKNLKDELHKYICGIINNKDRKVYAINGMPDHIHVLVSIRPNVLISDMLRDIKAGSSGWINSNKKMVGKFSWQEGFGAFSVSQSQLDTVIAYINNQEKHHQKNTFKQEYIGLLKAYNIEYNDKYIFDWIEE